MFVFLLHGRSFIDGLTESNTFAGKWLYFPAWSGVWIFFFLSGYLFSYNMTNNKYNLFNTEGNINLKQLFKFYGTRLLRLAPIYYLYMLLLDFFKNGEWILGNTKIALRSFLFCFNGTGGIVGTGHLWYISTAIQLYILIPFMYFIINKLIIKFKDADLLVFFVILVLGYAWRNLACRLSIDWYNWIYTFSLSNIDIVCCGLLAPSIVKKINNNNLTNKILSAILFTVTVVYNIYIYAESYIGIYRNIMPSIYIIVCLYLISSYRCDYRVSHGIINWFSKYTYVFYIFHIMSFLYTARIFNKYNFINSFSIGIKYILFFVMSFLITLAISYVFTEFFNFKRKKVKK